MTPNYFHQAFRFWLGTERRTDDSIFSSWCKYLSSVARHTVFTQQRRSKFHVLSLLNDIHEDDVRWQRGSVVRIILININHGKIISPCHPNHGLGPCLSSIHYDPLSSHSWHVTHTQSTDNCQWSVNFQFIQIRYDKNKHCHPLLSFTFRYNSLFWGHTISNVIVWQPSPTSAGHRWRIVNGS